MVFPLVRMRFDISFPARAAVSKREGSPFCLSYTVSRSMHMTRERAILNFLDEMEGRGLHGFILTLNGKTMRPAGVVRRGEESVKKNKQGE